jgi:hypothetical protein
MSAVMLVQGGLEALNLISTLITNAQAASAALVTAQTNGVPINLAPIQAAVAAAENAALAAINADPNTGAT